MGQANINQRPDQFAITEAYKQVKLNARQRAVNDAMELAKLRAGATIREGSSADDLIKDAKKIEAYLMEGIEAPSAVSSIVRATVGPQ